ncbi:hypothetical protein BGZ61DRAFT_471762 [Ilyonectria robusta]|uniref:uncharacterized protein n=1 Tax=Ilyonectria robusta TaxID=1079257 RepID=UPI001E8D7ED8|nr:uncharacterized protein BGZ61DRAFT_471762 [Ilyonectria robusta]KAH8738432.1 hypothetical protein BGZ61DRAFT_471762 [Ilyonectria robusta]
MVMEVENGIRGTRGGGGSAIEETIGSGLLACRSPPADPLLRGDSQGRKFSGSGYHIATVTCVKIRNRGNERHAGIHNQGSGLAILDGNKPRDIWVPISWRDSYCNSNGHPLGDHTHAEFQTLARSESRKSTLVFLFWTIGPLCPCRGRGACDSDWEKVTHSEIGLVFEVLHRSFSLQWVKRPSALRLL